MYVRTYDMNRMYYMYVCIYHTGIYTELCASYYAYIHMYIHRSYFSVFPLQSTSFRHVEDFD